MAKPIWGSRDDLREQLIQAFAERPEVYALHVFGREVEGKTDQYSDIDMIVCSHDLHSTQEQLLPCLNQISPVMGSLLLHSNERQLSQMYLFRDYTPYQKLDLSLVEHISQQAVFGPFLVVYERGDGNHSSASLLRTVPMVRDATHWLCEVLFSVPRFTKCLYRRDYDAYRRWMGLVRMLWLLLYERHFGWQTETNRWELKAPEAKELYPLLTDEERVWLDDICPMDSALNMPLSYRRGVELYVELSYQKAECLGTPLNSELIKHVMAFLHDETRPFE